MSNSSRYSAAAIMGGIALAAIGAGSVFAQDDALPEAPGKAVLTDVCTQCHATSLITQRRRTPDEWSDVVGRMEGLGAQMDAAQKTAIVGYLSVNLSSVAVPAPAGAAPPPAPGPTPPAPDVQPH